MGENEQACAGSVIPEFKTEKSFCLGKEDIFAVELVALLMALSYKFTNGIIQYPVLCGLKGSVIK